MNDEDLDRLIMGIDREADTEPDLHDRTDAERSSSKGETSKAQSVSDAGVASEDQEPPPVRPYVIRLFDLHC